MKTCEECNKETKQTFNGLCEQCLEKEEKQGNITIIYPKAYTFDGIDSVITKWDLERTKLWYSNYTGNELDSITIREIDIEKEGYWDSDLTEEEEELLDNLIGTQFTEIKKSGNINTFGDLRNLWGDKYKYISYKEGIKKYCLNIKEPEIIASTEF